MIVWLASYPRSGNTYLRIVLNRMFGVRSSVIYERDGVAQRLGADFVGLEETGQDLAALRRSNQVYFIKTHRQRDERVDEDDRAICLVRDGRDALVSHARLLSENDPARIEQELTALIQSRSPRGTGGWGANVLGWLQPSRPHRIVVRYEEFVHAPAGVVQEAMAIVAPSLEPLPNARLPAISELSKHDPGFFPRGVAGAWREEMPAHLHDRFWAREENDDAMKMLGYSR